MVTYNLAKGKNTLASISKLAKLELCSDHFFQLALQPGVLTEHPTIWLHGARLHPKYVFKDIKINKKITI
jgi:hypothetical protein